MYIVDTAGRQTHLASDVFRAQYSTPSGGILEEYFAKYEIIALLTLWSSLMMQCAIFFTFSNLISHVNPTLAHVFLGWSQCSALSGGGYGTDWHR